MTSHQSHDERRRDKRVQFKTKIILKSGASEISLYGSSKDLSVKGIFLETDQNISIGTTARIEVLLTGREEKLVLQIMGKVVRKGAAGVGIEFDSMDIDSYTHLKNIVRYNTEDPDKI